MERAIALLLQDDRVKFDSLMRDDPPTMNVWKAIFINLERFSLDTIKWLLATYHPPLLQTDGYNTMTVERMQLLLDYGLRPDDNLVYRHARIGSAAVALLLLDHGASIAQARAGLERSMRSADDDYGFSRETLDDSL